MGQQVLLWRVSQKPAIFGRIDGDHARTGRKSISLLCFQELQELQSGWRFEAYCVPPDASGTIWSLVSFLNLVSDSGIPQRRHFRPNLSNTACHSDSECTPAASFSRCSRSAWWRDTAQAATEAFPLPLTRMGILWNSSSIYARLIRPRRSRTTRYPPLDICSSQTYCINRPFLEYRGIFWAWCCVSIGRLWESRAGCPVPLSAFGKLKASL